MPVDYKKYPKDWIRTRARIKEREGHKCKFCNVPNYSVMRDYDDGEVQIYSIVDSPPFSTYPKIVPSQSDYTTAREIAEFLQTDDFEKFKVVVLTVAHLDHDEHNHDVKDERLAALCQRCHLQYDAREKARRRKAKKHKSQFKIQLDE